MIGEAIRRIHNNESVNSIFTAWDNLRKLCYNAKNYYKFKKEEIWKKLFYQLLLVQLWC
jgi:hypothetical protein